MSCIATNFCRFCGKQVKVISETSTKTSVTSFFLSLLATPKTCDSHHCLYYNFLVSESFHGSCASGDQIYWKQRLTLTLWLMSTPSPLTSVGSRFVLMLQEVHKNKANSLPLTVFSKWCLLLHPYQQKRIPGFL